MVGHPEVEEFLVTAGRRGYGRPLDQTSREQRKSGQYLDLDRMPDPFRLMDERFKAADNLPSIHGHHARGPSDAHTEWRVALVDVTSSERVPHGVQIAAVPLRRGYCCEIRRVEVIRPSPSRAPKFDVFHDPTVLLIGRGNKKPLP